jgi:hypothetical protein
MNDAMNGVRCHEWCAFLETLRQNPRYLGSLPGAWSSEDLKFAVDHAALPPNVLILAASQFGLNLKTPAGGYLLLCILADVIFRPEKPVQKGRPLGTKKWDQRKLSNLGFHAAMIKASNPKFGYEAIAGELTENFKEYQTVSPSHLRQLLPVALKAHESKLAALMAPAGRSVE